MGRQGPNWQSSPGAPRKPLPGYSGDAVAVVLPDESIEVVAYGDSTWKTSLTGVGCGLRSAIQWIADAVDSPPKLSGRGASAAEPGLPVSSTPPAASAVAATTCRASRRGRRRMGPPGHAVPGTARVRLKYEAICGSVPGRYYRGCRSRSYRGTVRRGD